MSTLGLHETINCSPNSFKQVHRTLRAHLQVLMQVLETFELSKQNCLKLLSECSKEREHVSA